MGGKQKIICAHNFKKTPLQFEKKTSTKSRIGGHDFSTERLLSEATFPLSGKMLQQPLLYLC